MVGLTFVGATGTVTGSCYLVEAGSMKFLVDCGLFQGPSEIDELNRRDLPFNPGDIDFILLTHAHIDHSGMIPRLYALGFRNRVVCTSATRDLCSVMLEDSGHIQESEAEWMNRKRLRAGKPQIEPLYTQADARACMELFDGYRYDELITLSPELRLRFRDAGHILGSASIEAFVRSGGDEVKIVFSGDVGNTGQPIIRDPAPVDTADYVLVESTYGDRDHEDSRDRAERLAAIVNDTVKSGGNVVIPAFAIGRTQEILYELRRLEAEKRIPFVPVYIDSPLAVSATEIFQKHPECFDSEMVRLLSRGESPFDFAGLHFTHTVDESKSLNEIKGCVIISASGMANAGRIKHHLKHNLWRKESTVLFVGFQAQGTLGRAILDGARTVRLFGEEVTVNARVESLGSFSAHADRHGLINWLSHIKSPGRVFIVHGEPEQSKAFSELVRSSLGYEAIIPSLGQSVGLAPTGLVKTEPTVDRSSSVRSVETISELLRQIDERTQEIWRSLATSPEFRSDPTALHRLEAQLRRSLAQLRSDAEEQAG